MKQQRLGQHGQRILTMIRSGERFRRDHHGWRCGTTLAPESVVQALVQNGAVTIVGSSLQANEAKRSAQGVSQYGTTARAGLLREIPFADADAGEPGRGMAKRAAHRQNATVNVAESPLSWLFTRKLITSRQYQAGECLRRDWTMAGMAPHVTMQWDRTPGQSGGKSGADTPTLAMLDARKRLDGAERAAGSGLVDILWRVVCYGEGIVAAEASLGWPRRSAKLVLLMALDRVADYYRIAE